MKHCKYYRRKLRGIRNLIGQYYCDLGHSTGGALHVVLDDYNIDDDSIHFCVNRMNTDTHLMVQIGINCAKRIAKLLLEISIQERALVVRNDSWHHWKWSDCTNDGDCENCPINKGRVYAETE